MQHMSLAQLFDCPAALDYFCLKILYPQSKITVKSSGCYVGNEPNPVSAASTLSVHTSTLECYKPDVLWNFDQTLVRVSIFSQPDSVSNVSASAPTLALALSRALVTLHYPQGASMSNEVFDILTKASKATASA